MTASQLALHLGAVGLLTMATGPGGLAWVGAVLLARRKGMRMQSPLYCLLMRNFVTSDMRDVAMDAARAAPPRPSAPLPLNGWAMRHAPWPFPPCAGTWGGSSPWSART